jgi:hypothetical protein
MVHSTGESQGGTRALREMGRRAVLKAGAAVAGGAALVRPSAATAAQGAAGAATTATTPLVRRDIWTMPTPWNDSMVWYARAVLQMQTRSASDPTSWSYQAAIHGTFVRPALTFWNNCQHQSWHFFPWHRMYLYYFERIVSAAVVQVGGPPDWTLPYWNYERGFPSNTLPAAFREPFLPDGPQNPLYLPTRRSDAIQSGFQLTNRQVSTTEAMATTVFAAVDNKTSFGGGPVAPAQFAGAIGVLERQPHNNVHNVVGGKPLSQCTGPWMSVIKCAANDPIFWLHHANIDRLWDVWLARGGSRANPTESAWRNQTFSFHDETGAQVSLSAADVLDTATQLGYVYG